MFADSNKISFSLPNGEQIKDTTTYFYDTSALEEGQYQISILGIDKAGNSINKEIMFTIDHTIIDQPQKSNQFEFDPLFTLILCAIVIAIAIGIIFSRKKRKIIKN